MSEERGFKAILKLNLPPAVQYHSGHSLILQGDTIGELKELLAEEVGEDQAAFIVASFFENVLLGGVKDALGVKHEAEAKVKPAPVEAAETPDDEPTPGQLRVAKRLGIDPSGMTKAALAAAIKKTRGGK